MTRRRWLADEVEGERAALTGEHALHLARVLRARVGQKFDVVTGEQVRRGRIISVNEHRVEFELGERVPMDAVEPMVLALAIIKFDRMEWAIEKCTELGVARFLPLISRRTDPHLAAAAAKRVERWRRIAREAAEQSRRGDAPQIDAPQRLKNVITDATGYRLVLAEAGAGSSLKQALQGAIDTPVIAVGPEGGWSGDEMQLFSRSGWQPVSLGATILRAETAAISAVAVAAAELE
jgi:16S rRNA (uracil1498-N3)-methyltransferase